SKGSSAGVIDRRLQFEMLAHLLRQGNVRVPRIVILPKGAKAQFCPRRGRSEGQIVVALYGSTSLLCGTYPECQLLMDLSVQNHPLAFHRVADDQAAISVAAVNSPLDPQMLEVPRFARLDN